MEEFLLQWHITAACDQNCKHCYMHEAPTFESEISNPLNISQCKAIIDDFAGLMKRWGMHGRINFTGGDPLLRDDFFEIIEYAVSSGISFGILGNPYHITDDVAKRLKNLGILQYQISLDGKEKTHDYFRRKGSYRDTMKAIKTLNSNGITSAVSFTLSKANKNELLDVIDASAKANAGVFDFSRLVPTGSGKSFKNDMLEPKEYRELLLQVLKKYKQLENEGCKTFFGRKDPLWILLETELGLEKTFACNKICEGCSIGMGIMSILADGTVYACRRLPIKIGKVPEQNLLDIFIQSKQLNEMREISRIKGCGNCELVNFCRGCRAVTYGMFSNYFEQDPQCWKEVTV